MKIFLPLTDKLLLLSCCLFLNSLGLYSKDEVDYKGMILKKHSEPVNAIAFSADDKYLFSGGDDMQMIKWDLESGEAVLETEAHYRPVREIVCLNDGVTILSAGDRAVKAWNTLLEKQDEVWTHHTDVWSFDVTSDNRKMISGTFEKKPYLWDLYSDEIIARPEAHEKTTLAVAFSHNGKYFATGSLDLNVFIWNTTNVEVEKAGIGHSENIYDVEFTPNDKYLVSVGNDKMVKIWNVETGGHYKTLSGHTDAIMCVCIHPSGRFFLTGSLDQTIRLWDIKTGDCIYTYIEHKDAVNDVEFNHRGNMFASASADKSIIIWGAFYEVVATYYFENELEQEWEKNSVFDPKRTNESRNDFLEREKKASAEKEKIYYKYFQTLLNSNE